MLQNGILPPPEYSREKVARILIESMRETTNVAGG
jgi:ATP sulfurylase